MASNESSTISVHCPSVYGSTWEYVEVRKQEPNRRGFFSLPGEIRNKIYHYALVAGGRRVILNPTSDTRRDERFNILQVHSAMCREAKTYFARNATVYLPVTSRSQPGLLEAWDQGVTTYEKHVSYRHTYQEALRSVQTVHIYRHALDDPRYWSAKRHAECQRVSTLEGAINDFVDYTRRYHVGRKRSLVICSPSWEPKLRDCDWLIYAMTRYIQVELTFCWGPRDKYAFGPELRPDPNTKRFPADSYLAQYNFRLEVDEKDGLLKGRYVRGRIVDVNYQGDAALEDTKTDWPALPSIEWTRTPLSMFYEEAF